MIPFRPTPTRVACALLVAALPAVAQQATPAPTQTLDQVVVVGFRKSLRSAEEIKRDSTQVVDSINAADIGAFPDRSIGDALQRVAGVQITRDLGETANVIIRGLPDVSTSVNGLEVFTGTGRRISYQDLPVMAVQGLDVYKSLTADILEGGIAGSVNVRLATPFTQGQGLQVKGRADLRRTDPQGSSASKPTNDPAFGLAVSNRTRTDLGEMGFLVDAYVQKDRFVYPVQWNDRPEQIWSVDANGNSIHVFRDANGVFQPARPGDKLATANFVGGIYNRGDRDRASLHGAFQWKPNSKLELSSHLLSMEYKNRFETDYIFSIVGWTPNATDVVVGSEGCLPNGGGQPLCPVISSTNPATRYGPNAWNNDPNTTTSTQAFRQKTRTSLATLGAIWRDGPLRLSSDLAFSRSRYFNERIVVDQRVMDSTTKTYTVGPDGHGGFSSVTTPTSQAPLRDPSQFALLALVQNWNEDTGRQAQWKTDAEWTLGEGLLRKVMGGLRLSERRAESEAANTFNDFPDNARPRPDVAFGTGFNRLVPGVDRLLGEFMTPDMNFLLDNTDKLRQGYGAPAGRAPADPVRSFSQRERNATVYLQGGFGFDVGDMSFAGNAGVRVIRVDRRLQGTLRTEQPAPLPALLTPLDMKTSETNVLPSIGLVASWTDRLQSHFSAGKTITRPTFGDLNPALALTAATVNVPGSGGAGNPDLQPTKSTSLDATLEYYFKKNGYVQVAAFDRRIDGYLQRYTRIETIAGKDYYVSRPQNSGKGRLHGVELGGQAFFDFLPGFWKDFGLQANYTLISGRNQTRTTLNGNDFIATPLTDVAKHNYNVVLMYQGKGLTGRLAATRRGAYADNVNDGDFHLVNTVRASTYVDFGLGYEISKNLSVQFDATNITREKYRSYIGDPSRPRDIRYTPSTYSLGLRVSL